MASSNRLSAAGIRARKGQRFPVITVYDRPFARFAENAGIDVLLVGDSLGLFVLGLPPEHSPELTDMCRHTAAVSRATRRAHVIADIPSTYVTTDVDQAVRVALALMNSGAHSVKVEGRGSATAAPIRAIAAAGIPVVAHLRHRSAEVSLNAEAALLEEAGAYAVVLSGIETEAASDVTRAVSIPTIGIGSGLHCDGQVAILHSVLGLDARRYQVMEPFIDLEHLATSALERYAQAVRNGAFPALP